MSNCIRTVLPSMSTDTFQGVAFPGDVNTTDDAVSEHGFKRISEIAGFSYGLELRNKRCH